MDEIGVGYNVFVVNGWIRHPPATLRINGVMHCEVVVSVPNSNGGVDELLCLVHNPDDELLEVSMDTEVWVAGRIGATTLPFEDGPDMHVIDLLVSSIQLDGEFDEEKLLPDIEGYPI